ncbi:Nramp family divalent metal transporter [Aureibacillus halotolerans]|uniref:Divalent metal cation transporter MntH n=1 Tax=Aureibacillus halotolerans TaxID=1508390 RepID=A0A4R6U245_9BACI|nr:Nramp family divalent metal transporter [Aureibacillus halotolerans]TDQ37174.1 manganese transport protein [Aureibacillus halotolerans]
MTSIGHSTSRKWHLAKLKNWLPLLGPAFVAGVAYIDPGNFATNLSAGSSYGYMLLWVIVVSNAMAFLIQGLSAKLGIATDKNLPQLTRDTWPSAVAFGLWIIGELVIMATDLAEFIGAAVGLHLLFSLPMAPAALLAAALSFLLLGLQRKGVRALEFGIIALLFVVVLAFVIQVFWAQPNVGDMLQSFWPPKFEGTSSVLLAAGILGATVMPHAIYLHSGLMQSRAAGRSVREKKRLFTIELGDIGFAMVIAGAVNGGILVVAAALFYSQGLVVGDLDVAYQQLGTTLGTGAALLFGIGLFASGIASSSVGTLAGDMMMQGFIRKHLSLYVRRAITIVPPLIVILLGVNPTYALVISQVILSFGIPFALIPLLLFTSNRTIMGPFVNRRWVTLLGWTIASVVIALNVFLLWQTFVG